MSLNPTFRPRLMSRIMTTYRDISLSPVRMPPQEIRSGRGSGGPVCAATER
jgi:hypothetical protein